MSLVIKDFDNMWGSADKRGLQVKSSFGNLGVLNLTNLGEPSCVDNTEGNLKRFSDYFYKLLCTQVSQLVLTNAVAISDLLIVCLVLEFDLEGQKKRKKHKSAMSELFWVDLI